MGPRAARSLQPDAGTDFTRGDVRLSVDDGRQARQVGGALFPNPVRSCHIWLPRQDPQVLPATVSAAITGRRVWGPSPPRPMADQRSGVIVRESRTPVEGCP